MSEARVVRIRRERWRDRDLLLASIRRLEQWPDSTVMPQHHFILFVAVDATSIDDNALEALANKLLGQGAAYVCAWGPECERVHQAFDVAREAVYPNDAERLVMTTSHADETLAEALWFALFTALPGEGFGDRCDDLLALSVGNDEWTAQIGSWLENPHQLNAEVLATD